MRSGLGPVVMVIEQASSFQTQLAAGLSSALEPLGIPLLVHLWGQSGALAPACLSRVLQDADLRAVVVTPLTHADSNEQLARLLACRPGLPQLYLGTDGPDCSVRADNSLGMRLVARHLVQDCHARRVLVVRGIGHHPDSQEREEAVRAELARLGAPVTDQQVVDGLFDREAAHRVVRAALERDLDIDAIAALNDRSALGAMDAVATLGRRVPEDVVVTGFDDEDFAGFSRPSLTTVTQNLHEQGAMAGELLARLLAGDDPGQVRVPVRLMVRGSTRRGRVVECEQDSSRADTLWGQVAALDAVLAMSRKLMSCGTIEEIVDQLSVNLPLLGITRGFLVLRTQEPGAARGVLAMAYHDGRRQEITGQEPFDVARQLPEHLREHLDHGTLIVQPLAVGDREIGYLVLDQALRRGSYIGEALRMDLSRTIDTIRSTARLTERTRQLETEVVSRRVAQQALAYQAHHDPLTGLANRAAFVPLAELAVAGADGAALMVVDLDRFKDVNDTLGHAVGDALLLEVAGRLSGLIGARGSVCRLGGDEFAVLAPGAGSPEQAMALAEEVVAALRDHFRLDGLTLEIDGSVGVACAPVHAEDAATLLRMADLAMYSAKSEHAGAALYDPDQHKETPGRLALFGELRRAVAEHELVLHYQPVTDVATGRVSGVEALVRWEHPTRGLLQPAEFLDIAEQTGLIHVLTTYVLDRALRDCRQWLDQGLSLVVAVNLSARRLMDLGLPDEVSRLLDQHGVPASLLVLEVTETAAMADPIRARSVLHRLRQLGVHLSVDDFGTGHASLAYLSRLPVTALKIDRSFVLSMESDPANMTIVRSTLDLARNLGLGVIAEGVETDSAYQTLASFGCDQAQGYWLARPGPADDIPDVITDIQRRLAAAADLAPSPDPVRAVSGVPQPRTHRDTPVDAPPPL